jgi:hypothetical protein
MVLVGIPFNFIVVGANWDMSVYLYLFNELITFLVFFHIMLD